MKLIELRRMIKNKNNYSKGRGFGPIINISDKRFNELLSSIK